MAAHILIIEDNRANRELMQFILVHYGHTVVTASDGKTGVDTARREHPDLVLCDIHVPKLDGFGVAQELKRDPALSGTPILAVSALAMVGDREKILAGGFDGYIPKPINPATFLSEAEAFLPAGQRSTPCPAPTPAVENTPQFRTVPPMREKILVVDNTPINIEVYRSTLEPIGYKVVAASTIEEALEACERERPDLVLVDYRLAKGTGVELVQAMRANVVLRLIPAIIISSSVTLGECLNQNLNELNIPWYTRPMPPQKLIRVLREELHKAVAAIEEPVLAETPRKS